MNPERKLSVIIVAGGRGARAGGELPKQFRAVGDKPMLMRTIEAFYAYDSRMHIVVVLPEGFESYWEQLCDKHRFRVPHHVTPGGETRFHSVKNGLELIGEEETVGVHDAARPFVTGELIGRCFNTVFTHHCGVIPVVEEVNSVRELTLQGSRMVDRKLLRVVQTPQVFPAAALKSAYDTSYDPAFTDDASVAERNGMHIMLVEGEASNLKITTPFDFLIAAQYDKLMSKR
jgi:2-C-methyl-D-erythritol 4-phosphate cytidylyltransferase